MPKFNAKTFRGSDRRIYATQFASVHLDKTGWNYVATAIAVDLSVKKSICARSFAEEFDLCRAKPRGRRIKEGVKSILGYADVWISFLGKESDGLHRAPMRKITLIVTEDSNVTAAGALHLDDHVIVLGEDFLESNYEIQQKAERFHFQLKNGLCHIIDHGG